jgi:hypothetical protein
MRSRRADAGGIERVLSLLLRAEKAVIDRSASLSGSCSAIASM